MNHQPPGRLMQLPALTSGRILRRYKRFLADVELSDGTLVTAHCPNTGSMTGCWQPGARVQLSYSDNPRRKLSWTLERVDMGAGWVGVNTARTNAIVAETIREGGLPELSGYGDIRPEVGYLAADGCKSRLDLKLSQGAAADALVEIKNVTLLQGECLMFPDAVSERARKHLDALQDVVSQGLRGVIIFACNRPEGRCFAPAEEIDPTYAVRLRQVAAGGVEPYALRLRHTADGIVGDGLLPLHLNGCEI